MRTRLLLSAFAFLLCFLTTERANSQGMGIDSVLGRIGHDLNNPQLADQLRAMIPNYSSQRVWGLAVGDFTNDSLPDVAISLYNLEGPKNQVHVYLLANENNQRLVNKFDKTIAYVESPIEVGLTTDASEIVITQKTGDQHWFQEGYTIKSGDVILLDRFETEQEDVTGEAKVKARSIGHDLYRNFDNLQTREHYFTGASGDAMFASNYFTLPSYRRLRDIYPGYGRNLRDTSNTFLLQGLGLRRDASDLSIDDMESAYDDDNLYISAHINDDNVVGGQSKLEANDRVSFWFDTKYTGDRLNRDRRLLSKMGGFPMFRDVLDSLVYNITFALPKEPGRLSEITYSSLLPLTPQQREGLGKVRAQMTFDTAMGVVNGYTLKVKIPFTFLGFETNPAKLYETKVPAITDERTSGATDQENTQSATTQTAGIGEAATLGFTTIVYDVDDASHPGEVTAQATSKYITGNPASFGTLILEPSSLYYGEVHPTYLNDVRQGLAAAGY